jgi:hypothetical protein
MSTAEVSDLRASAIQIASIAKMGTGTIHHDRLGTIEQRLEHIATFAQRIADNARKLYPNQPVLTPAQGLTWKTEL